MAQKGFFGVGERSVESVGDSAVNGYGDGKGITMPLNILFASLLDIMI
jgi:hypothetical protein